MDWLVCINNEGIQCQVPVGKKGASKKIAADEEGLEKKSKIKFIFEFGEGGEDPDKGYQNQKTFKDFHNVERQRLYKKYGAAAPSEIKGYSLRTHYVIGDGVEVLAELDAKNYEEFKKKYSGINGAIEVLYNTKKVMKGAGHNPAKTVSKLIRKLEIETED